MHAASLESGFVTPSELTHYPVLPPLCFCMSKRHISSTGTDHNIMDWGEGGGGT